MSDSVLLAAPMSCTIIFLTHSSAVVAETGGLGGGGGGGGGRVLAIKWNCLRVRGSFV